MAKRWLPWRNGGSSISHAFQIANTCAGIRNTVFVYGMLYEFSEYITSFHETPVHFARHDFAWRTRVFVFFTDVFAKSTDCFVYRMINGFHENMCSFFSPTYWLLGTSVDFFLTRVGEFCRDFISRTHDPAIEHMFRRILPAVRDSNTCAHW